MDVQTFKKSVYVTLSRRNILELLEQLDGGEKHVALYRVTNADDADQHGLPRHMLYVLAEEDAVHYKNRNVR